MTYFQFGNLTIPGIWISAVIALILSSLLNRFIGEKKTEEWLINGFILLFLVWKLSYVLFHFSMFIEMPLSIIYFSGGWKGQILALVVVSIYLLVFAGKKYPSIYKESTRIFLFYYLIYEITISFLEKNIVETFLHFIVFAGFVVTLFYLKKKETTLSRQIVIVIYMLELLIISLFQPIFTMELLTFTWLAVTMLILTKKR